MNILGYIGNHSENNVAELVVTVADCLSTKEFERNGIRFWPDSLRNDFPPVCGRVSANREAVTGMRTAL